MRINGIITDLVELMLVNSDFQAEVSRLYITRLQQRLPLFESDFISHGITIEAVVLEDHRL